MRTVYEQESGFCKQGSEMSICSSPGSTAAWHTIDQGQHEVVAWFLSA